MCVANNQLFARIKVNNQFECGCAYKNEKNLIVY